MCYRPILIKNKKTKQFMKVPCYNKCQACIRKVKKEWLFRLSEEMKVSSSTWFSTLTYSDENLVYGEYEQPILCKRDIQLFMKKLRRKQERQYSKLFPFDKKKDFMPKIKYYAVGEYGSKHGRPHYHVILFNCLKSVIEDLHNIWSEGTNFTVPATMATLQYTTNYMLKKTNKKFTQVPEFNMMSKNPAIGYDYIKTNGNWHRETGKLLALNYNGKMQALPRYYRNKIFDENELQILQYASMVKSELLKIEHERELRKKGIDPWEYQLKLRERSEQKAKLILNKTIF